MGEVTWVEILSRHHEVMARHRLTGAELRIGRGYDNDLVLDDPFVAVNHLRIFRDPAGDLVAEDIGSANGMFVDRGRVRRDRVALGGNETIRIGNTHLRVRGAHHAVARERILRRRLRRWPLALVLATANIGIGALTLWLEETGEPKVSHYLLILFGALTLVAAWTAVWALLSRVFSGQSQFDRNLIILLAGILAYRLYTILAKVAAFSLAWHGPADYQFVALWAILAAICFFHLQAIRVRWRTHAAAVSFFAVAAIAAQSLSQSEAQADFGRPVSLGPLLPPSLRLAPVKSEAAFFAGVERLKANLDRDRATADIRDRRP